MATYNTQANVTLSLNGQQARKMMDTLASDAKRLEGAIAKAASAGDKATMKKLQRELGGVNRAMDQLRQQGANVEDVLRRLDTATPKELRRTLTALKRQLDGMERGSEAWDAQVEKIRRVKSELTQVNATLREQQGFWERLKGSIGNALSSVGGFSLSIAGIGYAVNRATEAYMSMDEEMAGVRKYTGMTVEEVEALNEEFKNMETRTPREELNRLAQEAGRLGKTSKEDVLGFVRASNQVNVALDDLGEGATLTLSKLTGIFGDEEKYGTEQSLLKVGSVINELSQSCSASAPYIAEFASRMGGVAAQANMTVDQVMAFGAVLDANNQNVEASATALSQIITRIYQEPAKYAQVLGLDVQRFTTLVKTDMNGALMEMLAALNQAGGMDVLAPMFKDMGENGSRAISALSALAKHLDDVKEKQQMASKAFEEGISVSKEAEVQENTAAARMERMKQALHETEVELGARLFPAVLGVMKGLVSFIDVAKQVIKYLWDHKYQIVALTASYGVYVTLVNLAAIKTKALAAAKASAVAITRTWNVLLGAGKVAMAALNIVVGLLTGGIKGARTAMSAFNATVKANPLGAFIALATAAVSVVSIFTQKNKEATEAEKDRAQAEKEAAAERQKQYQEWKQSLTDIGQASADFCKEEITRLDMLYKAATDEAKSKEERRQAANRLQELYPAYFKNMTLEQIMVGQAVGAYDNLRESILKAARAKAILAKIEENQGQIIDIELEQRKLRKEKEELDESNPGAKEKPKPNFIVKGGGVEAIRQGNTTSGPEDIEFEVDPEYEEQRRLHNKRNKLVMRLAEIAVRKNDLEKANNQLIGDLDKEGGSAVVSTKTIGVQPTPSVRGAGGSGSQETGDKFAKEKEWREQQEALASIDYRTGKKNYEEYTKRMDEIAVQFYSKQLEHSDLGKTERLKIEAQYHEAVAKQDENSRKLKLQEIEDEYNEQGRTLKQNYVDGLISKETYDLKTQEAEMDHQLRLSQCMEIGEEDRLKAQDKYNDMLLQNREKAHKEFLDSVQRLVKAAKEQQDKLDKIKQDVFGLNKSERDTQYAADLALLNTVYQRELAAAQGNADEKLRIEEAYQKALKELREKYMQDGASDGGLKGAVEKSRKWLESDGGKALTGTMSTLTSGMSSIFSQLTSSMQADLEMQTAAINRRYDAEISRAEGNSYKVAQLEKRKEAEIAAAKNEANRKMFAMQVIQAIAQTAQNAISAYGAGLQIGGLAGLILAPIAAGMAVAAGMLQIANIKKQQQASASQGYEQGGFTTPGRKDEPAGIVHAGEWVAPQSLVNSPVTRPLIDALEQARLGNTRPAITALDVSRTIMAPVAMAAAMPTRLDGQRGTSPTNVFSQSDKSLDRTLRKLNNRLDRPFVAVSSITGETGMHKAERDYKRLMANKSPRRYNNS